MKMNETQKGFVRSAIEMADQAGDSVIEERFDLTPGTIQKLRDGIVQHGGLDNLPLDFMRRESCLPKTD